MYKTHSIAVVVPALNEENQILDVINGIPAFVDHIIVVDDHSTDLTSERARLSNDPRVEVVGHTHTQGVGGSIVSGHQRAIQLSSDIVTVMAGDGQMDPQYLTKLLDAIVDEGYDYVKGNRFKAKLDGMPWIRILGNVILSLLTKLASGYWQVFDSQNGFTAIKTSALKRLDLGAISRGYEFENDMLIRLNIARCRIKDVAIPAVYKEKNSRLNVTFFAFSCAVFLFKAFHLRIYREYFFPKPRPFAYFYVSGWSLVGLSLILRLCVLSAENRGVMTGLALTLGIAMLMVAISIDMMKNERDWEKKVERNLD